MGKKLNVGIVGAGDIAGQMSVALKAISDEVNLYAVASRKLEKAEAFKEEWGYEKAYGSYEELAADDKVDLVYVATPHSEHYENTKLCLNYGRNCLVEKAFCGNSVQTNELIRLAKEKNVLLAEAMWTRYLPSRQVVEDIISAGTIGDIKCIESDFSIPIFGVERLINPALAGGALLDLGVYSLTVPAMYIDREISKVEIESILGETGVDLTDVITITYEGGIVAKAKCSSVDEHSTNAKIIGEKGYMIFGPINAPEGIDIYDNEGTLIKKIDTPYIANGYEYEVLECKK